MTNSVLAATFSDFRLVRGRKVAQLILEIPIEQAEAALHLIGMPMPDCERWVAIAPMVGDPNAPAVSPPAEQAAPPTHRNVPERAPLEGWERDRQRAVMLCKDTRFQAWCGCADEAQTIAHMRAQIGGSRSGIATDHETHRQFLSLETTYRADTGLLAARR